MRENCGPRCAAVLDPVGMERQEQIRPGQSSPCTPCGSGRRRTRSCEANQPSTPLRRSASGRPRAGRRGSHRDRCLRDRDRARSSAGTRQQWWLQRPGSPDQEPLQALRSRARRPAAVAARAARPARRAPRSLSHARSPWGSAKRSPNGSPHPSAVRPGRRGRSSVARLPPPDQARAGAGHQAARREPAPAQGVVRKIRHGVGPASRTALDARVACRGRSGQRSWDGMDAVARSRSGEL